MRLRHCAKPHLSVVTGICVPCVTGQNRAPTDWSALVRPQPLDRGLHRSLHKCGLCGLDRVKYNIISNGGRNSVIFLVKKVELTPCSRQTVLDNPGKTYWEPSNVRGTIINKTRTKICLGEPRSETRSQTLLRFDVQLRKCKPSPEKTSSL